MTGSHALLGLLHPDGVAERVIVLGGACPVDLAPADPAATTGMRDRAADLVVVAPTASEARAGGWVDHAIRSLPDLVAADGLVYLLLPAGARRHARRRLRAVGFALESDMLHLPSWEVTRQIVPLRRDVMRPALRALDLSTSLRRRLFALALGVPGVAGFIAGWHGSIACIARPAGARPLFTWLLGAAGVRPNGGTATVRAKSRAGKTGIVLQAFDYAGRSVAIAKTTLLNGAPDGRTEREAANLGQLGPAARVAGAAAPSARLVYAGTRPVMIGSVVPGESASDLLGSHRLSVDVVLDRLTAWLERWHRATVSMHVLRPEWLERAVLIPARLVCPRVDDGGRYLTELEERCSRLAGTSVPLVATHGDLTMSNLLIPQPTGLGVVDWEVAQAEGLPLRDFWYGAVDAVAARDRYKDRPAAFARCFVEDDALRRQVAAHATRLQRAIGLGDEFATVCFHACWLQHAVDEQRKRAPGEPKPFRAIVEWIARHSAQLAVGVTAGVSA